jgi:hypothetical protein
VKQTPRKRCSLSPIPGQDSKKRQVESSRRTTGMATLEANEVNRIRYILLARAYGRIGEIWKDWSARDILGNEAILLVTPVVTSIIRQPDLGRCTENVLFNLRNKTLSVPPNFKSLRTTNILCPSYV